MEKTAGRILKANEVKLQGQYHLNVTPTAQSPAIASRAIAGAPQVRIVENNADHAVIEITCPCGTQSHIRCDYAPNTN